MAKKNGAESNIQMDSVKHVKEERVNIPTEELRDFVAGEEKKPKTILYPRDPSLDPQLVWKSKDEQDASDLAVPAVPVYIQEQIHPQAIIEALRQDAKQGKEQEAIGLFADFNGIPFEDKIDFYHHSQKWTNRMILGDSLLVMNSLAEKEGLKGKVQTIYFDPPYGIKFGSNWQVSTRKRDVKDSKAEDATRQPEQVKAFRDTWKLGIHSYLAYLRDRLAVARELLNESGSIFVQIGDENVHLVRCLLDEIFGSENFVSQIVAIKTSSATSDYLAGVADIILFYAKSKSNLKYRQLYAQKELGGEGTTQYVWLLYKDKFRRRRMTDEDLSKLSTLKDIDVYAADNLTSQRPAQQGDLLSFEYRARTYFPGKGTFKTDYTGMTRLAKAGRLEPIGNSLMYRRLLNDFDVSPINNIWRDVLMTGFSESKTYVVQTSSKIIQKCILMTTDPGDLVLDPTCGSGTTAFVAEQWGRRWITIDTSRVALALARTRLMVAKYPYYLLADSSAGQKKEAEATGKLPADSMTEGDIRKGFVYKRVPHITLKAIANNADIDAVCAKWKDKLEPLLAKLNHGLGKKWAEWEVPFDVDAKWSEPTRRLHSEYLEARQARQSEIDNSINRSAEYEMLYDQPYEDNKCVRVTGPFTVESLSPYRIIAAEEERPKSEVSGQREGDTGQYVDMVLGYLRRAGVQNTIKKERLKFDRLEVYPGEWLQATGEYADAEGKTRRAAVSIGPETGTVGPEQVKEAVKEAVQGLGHDVLLVCGFAFDPHVSEESKRYGGLTVLPVRMNADLLMGGDLLKNTGTGNMFMVFGEPDISVKESGADKITVELKGLDIYDPTTGEIRASSTEEIACWFIDTNYNGECFNVRHSYFTGGNEPYESLKKALRADIDEAAWDSLYSTTSRPFAKPTTGKIAIKVINHYGDEVLKVFPVK